VKVGLKQNRFAPDFVRRLKNLNAKVNTTRMIIFNLPDTRDPDTDKPCRHQCDVRGLGPAAFYENNTRKLVLYPNRLLSLDDFLVSCVIRDFGVPTKSKTRYFFISFIKPNEQTK
jgi:hypothetical protein